MTAASPRSDHSVPGTLKLTIRGDLLAQWLWEPQADVLDAVYSRLLDSAR